MTERPRIRVRQTKIIDRPGSPVHGLRVRIEDKEIPIVSLSDPAGAALENPLAETLKEINVQLSRQRTPKIVLPPPLKR